MDTIYVGLTSAEASQSRHVHGVNTLPEKKTDSLFISFLKQFNNPLIYVLIVVAVITTVLGEYADTFVIMIVTVVNAVIGTVQNRKANNVLNSLKSLSRSRTKVIRNGIIEEIFIAEVVVGDYVVLSAGDIVPADGLLVEHRRQAFRGFPKALHEHRVPALVVALGHRVRGRLEGFAGHDAAGLLGPG